MRDDEFAWDDDKAVQNRRVHRVSFEEAALALRDPFAIEWPDNRENYGEERGVLVGMSQGQLLTVVYTERGDRLRVISARKATRHEQDDDDRQNAP
ncbi:MAG: BrnT family toxin [Alphaproteobacteria bacterium]